MVFIKTVSWKGDRVAVVVFMGCEIRNLLSKMLLEFFSGFLSVLSTK
jgi:hypothetical protein